jgi:hypothetical protein
MRKSIYGPTCLASGGRLSKDAGDRIAGEEFLVKSWSPISGRLPVFGAGASLLLTSAAYGWYGRTGTPLPLLGLKASTLVGILQVECFVVPSFPFIMAVLLQRPRSPQWKGVRVLVFAILILGTTSFVFDLDGWEGIGLFVSLTAMTYLGFFVGVEERLHRLPELALRWIANVLLLFALVGWFQLPSEVESWEIDDGVLPVGGLYFLTLAMLELSGFYESAFLRNAGRILTTDSARRVAETPKIAHDPGTDDWYRAAMPIAGSAALNLGPLLVAGYLAGAGARFIDARFEWPLSDHLERLWFPLIMILVLLPVRCYQLHLVLGMRERARARSGASRAILRFGVLATLYILVAALRYRADPTYHFAYALFPADAYGGFVLLEIPLLLFLVPATWARLGFGAPGALVTDRLSESTRSRVSPGGG